MGVREAVVRRAPIIGVLPLAAAVLLLNAPAASASTGAAPDVATSLGNETVTLDAGAPSDCDPGATQHSEHLTGLATGPFNGSFDATATTTVTDSLRTTVVTFSIGSQVTGTQSSTTQASTTQAGDQGPCAGLTGELDYHVLIGTTADQGTVSVTADPGTPTVLTFASTTPTATPSPSTPAPSPPASSTPASSTPTSLTPAPSTPAPSTPAPSTPTPSTPAATPTQPASGPLTFAYDARPDPAGGYAGSCRVDGGSTMEPVEVLCTTITGYHDGDHHVRFTGRARINGTPTTYRIDVTDGAAHHRPDVFRIATGTGFVAGGELASGNLRVR